MTTKIYKLTDRITVKIDNVEFKLAPLSWGQKQEIVSEASVVGGNVNEMTRNATFKALKYAIKGISGVEYADGTQYELEFDENGNVLDSSLEELLNMELSPRLIMACYAMVNGVPTDIINPATGKKVEGVEVVKKEGKQKSKQKA